MKSIWACRREGNRLNSDCKSSRPIRWYRNAPSLCRTAGRPDCGARAGRDRLAVHADELRDDPVNVLRGDFLERVRGRGVGQERDPVTAVERIDGGRETRRLPRKPRQHEISAALAHDLIEART